jgi:hypothetical protein
MTSSKARLRRLRRFEVAIGQVIAARSKRRRLVEFLDSV